ncbi:hypothetical protein T08_9124 [Trichinella sp. T8]|nr:hypothetical protein T08_6135 [Trichinella sp. T8]KRZ85288.1 hypothetical protein T08_9124 [Trichinella sp. T8]
MAESKEGTSQTELCYSKLEFDFQLAYPVGPSRPHRSSMRLWKIKPLSVLSTARQMAGVRAPLFPAFLAKSHKPKKLLRSMNFKLCT